MKEFYFNDGKTNILGRTVVNDEGLNLFWTGSGVEFITDASEAKLFVDSCYNEYEIWITVELNGEPSQRLLLDQGKRSITLFRGLTGKHHVRILRESQADLGYSRNRLVFEKLELNEGASVEKPEHGLTLEFVGDSITSGEGLNGAKEENDWVMSFFGFRDDYARVTSDLLNAEYRIISQSGWGYHCGFNNDTNMAIPRVYEYLCLGNEIAGKDKKYDFNEKPADFVIIYLGSNDMGGFTNDKWVDPISGKESKLTPDSNGGYDCPDGVIVTNDISNFLGVVREKNPKAHIILIEGMLGHNFEPLLRKAMLQFKEKHDDKITLLSVPDVSQKGYGSRLHPGKMTHEAAATVIVNEINSIVGKSDKG